LFFATDFGEVAVSRFTQWVTFDCFGTLVDWQSGLAVFLAPYAGDKARSVVRSYHAHERILERAPSYRPYADVLATGLARAAAEHGVELGTLDASVLRRAWASMRLFDDVEAMLAELRSKSYGLAVLTNCDDDLFEITHRSFKAPFDLFLTSERVRSYKPAPWHFRGFERLTGASRAGWVHVACSWYHDIEPARRLGITPVWLDRERTGEDPSSASAHVHAAADVVTAVGRLFETSRGGIAQQREVASYAGV
jgi:2-haloacid dehalogenase